MCRANLADVVNDDVSRRDVVAGTGTAVLATVLSGALADRALAKVVPHSSLTRLDVPTEAADVGDDPGETFPQSVASGDPTPAGVVVWTRVAPGAYRPDAPLFLDVAPRKSDADVDPGRDEPEASGGGDFADATRYRIDPGEVTPAADHTVRVDLDGALDSDAAYRYRFEYDGARSRVGRCRTLPAPEASPDGLRLAVLTCQNYRTGYYGAYRHLAEDEVDFLVHLGDFVYETAGSSPYEGRDVELPSGESKAMGLADFRHVHRTYRSDSHLAAALRRHTLIATWDDHEIVNDRYWDYEADVPATDDHPRADDPEFLTGLFADGIQAWWEYLPTRVRYDPDADHLHDALGLWRSFRFGDLAELLVTDERLFRSEPPTPTGLPLGFSTGAPADPGRTMLGRAQREWFERSVAEADATWTAWANEVLLTSLRLSTEDETLYNADAWDGYEAERRRLMAAIGEADLDNFVALTGDMHTALAAHVQDRYPVDEDAAEDDDPTPTRLGVEFMAPAVTSPNLAHYLALPSGSAAEELVESIAVDENPHLEFFNSHRWGYATVEFTPEACTYTAYAVEKDVDPEDADREVLRRLRVPAGSVQLREVD